MSIKAKVIADSISEEGIRLTTLQVTMPKFLLAQLNTHRMFSRNAASSRAIPTSKVIERVRSDAVVPTYWGRNKPGMQASEELSDMDVVQAQCAWYAAISNMVSTVYMYDKLGVHKQIANRLLEPFMYVDVVISATEWSNFYHLRLAEATQPEMRLVAWEMKVAMDNSEPEQLCDGEWHAPYLSVPEFKKLNGKDKDWEDMLKCSVARCARVSYLTHDKSDPDVLKDLELYDRLLKDRHMSPFEHQATPMVCPAEAIDGTGFLLTNPDYWPKGHTHIDKEGSHWSGNFKGFLQHRQLIQGKL